MDPKMIETFVKRSLSKRRRDCESKATSMHLALTALVEPLWEARSEAPKTIRGTEERLTWLLLQYLKVAENEAAAAGQRRQSFEAYKRLLKQVDDKIRSLSSGKATRPGSQATPAQNGAVSKPAPRPAVQRPGDRRQWLPKHAPAVATASKNTPNAPRTETRLPSSAAPSLTSASKPGTAAAWPPNLHRTQSDGGRHPSPTHAAFRPPPSLLRTTSDVLPHQNGNHAKMPRRGSDLRQRREAPRSSPERRKLTVQRLRKLLFQPDLGSDGVPKVIDAKPDERVGSATSATMSGSVNERLERRNVHFRQTPVQKAIAVDVLIRLERWEPYWTFTNNLVYVAQTCRVEKPNDVSSLRTALSVKTLASRDLVEQGTDIFSIIPHSDWGKVQTSLSNGQSALILRTLPVSPDQKKRADCHLWPKGTFLQLQGKPIPLGQRKQQAHELSEWKNICRLLDITTHIRNPRQEIEIEMCCYDDQPYLFCLSICQYRDPDQLYEDLTDPASAESLRRVSRDGGIARLKNLVYRENGNTICIDDDVTGGEKAGGKFVFKLTCPISMSVMETPVRGKKCKHWQCFDLRTFLHANERPSGSRWRCATCNHFLAAEDLEICDFTRELLHEYKDEASTEKCRIEFHSDGSYHLLDAKPTRKRPAPEEANAPRQRAHLSLQGVTDDDVIDLL